MPVNIKHYSTDKKERQALHPAILIWPATAAIMRESIVIRVVFFSCQKFQGTSDVRCIIGAGCAVLRQHHIDCSATDMNWKHVYSPLLFLWLAQAGCWLLLLWQTPGLHHENCHGGETKSMCVYIYICVCCVLMCWERMHSCTSVCINMYVCLRVCVHVTMYSHTHVPVCI